MKIISLDEAKNRFPAILEEALSGEVIRFRSSTGVEVELAPVPKHPPSADFSSEELAKAYDDPEWAAFENNCGKASD
jgi:hypothetical protein